MDKVYLLLRNNKQIGPLSLDELTHLSLKPTDLIWIEGRSSGWAHPYELDVLKPLLSADATSNTILEKKPATAPDALPQSIGTSSKQAHKGRSSRLVYVSMPAAMMLQPVTEHQAAIPAQNLEQKAEELRRRVQAYAAEHKEEPLEQEGPVFAPRTLHDLKDSYSAWQQTQKRKKKKQAIQKRSISIMVAILLLGVGYVLAKGYIQTKESGIIALTEEYNLKQEVAQMAKASSTDNSKKSVAANDTKPEETELVIPEKRKESRSVPKKRKPSSASSQSRIIVKEPVNDIEVKLPLTVAYSNLIADKSEEKITAITEHEKRGGKKFNLFSNKRKHTETGKASKVVDPAAIATLSVHSHIDKNTGEKGLKLTLHNSSAETIKRAAVELRYFNNKNGLIEKKVITFTNITSNGSATQIASNNPSADHTYYRLLEAVN